MGDAGGAVRQDVAVWRPRHLYGVEVVCGRGLPSAPRHFHEELEIGLKQGGGWEFHHRGAWHAVAPGTLVLTPPGDVHMMRSPHGPDDAVYHGLRLDADLLRRAATDLAGHPWRGPDFATPLVQDRDTRCLILRLIAALADGSTASPLAQESWLQDALGHLILRHGAAKVVPSPVGTERGAIRRVRQYLEEYAARTVTLAELAYIAELSTFHLCRVFGAAVGMPPHAYQTQVRVVRAKALLVAGRLPLAQIGTEVGFASQSHFTRHFMRLVGTTPGQYVRDSR
ncbi:MAG: AraC family transcriptional regulator [Chloroflexota bacterium]|nr:AraC family transcriptional regulator [Chloroflexota bacterium]